MARTKLVTMAQAMSGPRGERQRKAVARVFLSMCALGVVGVVFYLDFAFIVGPGDPMGRCAFYTPTQLSSDQVELTWSENLFTNTLNCTWSSVDDAHATTFKISAY